MADLNETQFPLYHGTSKDIEGGFVRPAAGEHGHGKGSWWGSANESRGEAAKDYAWAAKSEDDAWAFAGQGSARGATTRPRVYEVEDAQRTGSAGGDKSITGGEVKSSVGFAIKGQIDTAPGRQGTFPEVNWHQFADQRGISSWEANHPTDEAIKYGHRTQQKAGIEDSPGTIENNYNPSSADRYVQEHLRRQHAMNMHPGQSDPSTAEFMQHQKEHHSTGADIGHPKLFDVSRGYRKVARDPHKGMDDDYSRRVRIQNERATEWQTPEEYESRRRPGTPSSKSAAPAASSGPLRKMAK